MPDRTTDMQENAERATAGSNPLLGLMDHRIRHNPYPWFARMCEAGPTPAEDGSVVIFGQYEHCNQILRHREMGNDTSNAPYLKDLRIGGQEIKADSAFFMDPPEHGRQRKLFSKSFNPRIVAGFEPQVTRIVDDAFMLFRGRGHFDVVSELASPVAFGIICDMYGISHEDRHMLLEWDNDMAFFSELPTLGAAMGEKAFPRDETPRIARTLAAIHSYFGDLIYRRRKNPGDDLVSSLLAVQAEIGDFTRNEFTNAVRTLFSAAHESATNLISSGILALLRNPDQLAVLRDDPGVITSLVEEALRYDPPVQLLTRMSLGRNTIGGYELEPGNVVVVLVAAANRDPRSFPDPDVFDVRRKTTNFSLTFGAGAHFCIGFSLAKLEAEIAIAAFAERLRDPELDEDSLIYRRHVAVRGLESMIVSFKP